MKVSISLIKVAGTDIMFHSCRSKYCCEVSIIVFWSRFDLSMMGKFSLFVIKPLSTQVEATQRELWFWYGYTTLSSLYAHFCTTYPLFTHTTMTNVPFRWSDLGYRWNSNFDFAVKLGWCLCSKKGLKSRGSFVIWFFLL